MIDAAYYIESPRPAFVTWYGEPRMTFPHSQEAPTPPMADVLLITPDNIQSGPERATALAEGLAADPRLRLSIGVVGLSGYANSVKAGEPRMAFEDCSPTQHAMELLRIVQATRRYHQPLSRRFHLYGEGHGAYISAMTVRGLDPFDRPATLMLDNPTLLADYPLASYKTLRGKLLNNETDIAAHSALQPVNASSWDPQMSALVRLGAVPIGLLPDIAQGYADTFNAGPVSNIGPASAAGLGSWLLEHGGGNIRRPEAS